MVRSRSIPMAIVLTIVTCGIYGIFWYIALVDDINTITGEPGVSGGMAFVYTLITCGIYSIFWGYKTGEKLDAFRARNNQPTGSLAILYLLLNLFGLSIVTWSLAQSEVNKYATPAV